MLLQIKELPKDHNLVLFGDFHFGNPLTHYSGIKEAIYYVKSDRRAYSVFMGDGIEGIVIDDSRIDLQSKISFPEQEKNDLKFELLPIKNKIINYLIGNHEWKLLKFGNMASAICNDLNIPYGSYSSKISIYNHSLMYRVYVHHGTGTLNSKNKDAAKRKIQLLEKLKSKLFDQASDCHVMAMGHTHKMLIYTPEEQNGLFLTGENRISQHYELPPIPEEGFIHPDFRYYINTGGFVKLQDATLFDPMSNEKAISGYAERMMLSPLELGFVVLEVRRGKIVGAKKIAV